MKWIFQPEVDIPASLHTWTQDPLLARLLVQRSITDVETARKFLDPNYYTPASPYDLPDMDKAVYHLRHAIADDMPICVWGDFDVDGQTSTALLVSLLQHLGANVSYHVPDRITEGHGIRLYKVEEILEQGIEFILTCDTGIEEYEAVEAIHSAGKKIVITDHHDLGNTLPSADAVVNPKRLPKSHPLRQLPGVGVVYKLAQALTDDDNFITSLLDLVALGIVADVAEQKNDTRYLLQCGLDLLRQSERLGLLALIEMANLNQSTLNEEHIGFWLGPRLNALGRLGDANQAVELLTTSNKGRAKILASQLNALNERRRVLVDETVTQVLAQIEENPELVEYNALVVAQQGWHPGVIGIACSRLAEQFARPVILFTYREGMARGSARSVKGCDIHQAIKTQAHLIDNFGGHPMAAGLSMNADNVIDFRRGLSQALANCMTAYEPSLNIDLVVTIPELNMSILNTIHKLAPFGASNPSITIVVKNVIAKGETIFGRTRTHRRVGIADTENNMTEVIWWRGADEYLPTGRFDVALTIRKNEYQAGVQLTWQAMQERAPEFTIPKRQIIDYRTESEANIAHLFMEDEIIFYSIDPLPNVNRIMDEITPTKKLVIWQAPPSQAHLENIVAAVQPEIIYLVAKSAPYDKLPNFIRQLMGLIKYSIVHYEGHVNLSAIAKHLGHKIETVQHGITWLVLQGKLDVQTVKLSFNALDVKANFNALALNNLLKETASYRKFVKTAKLLICNFHPINS